MQNGWILASISLSLPFALFRSVFSVSTVFLLTGWDDVPAAEPVAVCFVPFNSATLCKEIKIQDTLLAVTSGLQLKMQSFYNSSSKWASSFLEQHHWNRHHRYQNKDQCFCQPLEWCPAWTWRKRNWHSHTREAVPVRKKRQRAVTAVRHWRKEQEGWVYSKVLEN